MKNLLKRDARKQNQDTVSFQVRTQLQAGRSCHTYDSSCRSRQGFYDNCGGKIPGDGSVCFAANLANGVPFKDAVCEAC